MKTVDVQDLLGLGFEAGQLDPASGSINCQGAVIEVHRRLGWCTAHMAGHHLQAETIVGDPWEFVGDEACQATQVGDLILSYPRRETPHVSVVVDPSLGLAFSSFEGHGAMVCPLGKIGRVRGVYRLREDYR